MFKSNETNEPIVELKTDRVFQTSQVRYNVEDGRRVKSESGAIRKTICMDLPLPLTPQMWKRHNYSLGDVVSTLNSFKSMNLWQLAVALGLQVPNSSVKITFSNPVSMVFSSKAIVMNKIAQHLKQHYQFAEQNTLDTQHEGHVPALPLHRIPLEDYERLKLLIRPCFYLKENNVPTFYQWRDMLCFPIQVSKQAIVAVRVVSECEFGRELDSLCTRPLKFVCEKKVYYGLNDETCLFLPRV